MPQVMRDRRDHRPQHLAQGQPGAIPQSGGIGKEQVVDRCAQDPVGPRPGFGRANGKRIRGPCPTGVHVWT
jgi:hypothetical protein